MPDLIIASGERNLCAELLALKVPYSVEPLAVGDIVIRRSGAGPDAPPVVVLERKSIADLMASIVDGRYREQATRLSAVSVTTPVWWIIEGRPQNYRRDAQATSRMFAAIARLGLLHQFVPVRTESTQETAMLLQKLLAKTDEVPVVPEALAAAAAPVVAAGGGVAVASAGAGEEYSHPHKRFKSDCITRENVQAMMLAQVPGVSVSRARAILDAIPLADILNGAPIPKGLKSSSGPGKEPRTIPKNVLAAIEDYLHPEQPS
jgi:ERCC4-type nuclease